MTDESPVRVVSRAVLFANSVWQVVRNHIRTDTGGEITDYVTLAPKTPRADGVAGVTVLPVAGGRLGLVRMYRHPLAAFCWEAPRGFIDEGETPAQAALRELGEEAGLVCAASDLMPLGLLAPEASTFTVKGALFAATRCRPGHERDAGEAGLGELSWFAPREIRRMLGSFEIEDATTVAALYRYFQVMGW